MEEKRASYFRGTNRCQKKRLHDALGLQAGKRSSSRYPESVAQFQAIKEALEDNLDNDQIQKLLFKSYYGFETSDLDRTIKEIYGGKHKKEMDECRIRFGNHVTRTRKFAEACKNVYRYVTCERARLTSLYEKRKLVALSNGTVDLFGMYSVNSTSSLYFMGEEMVAESTGKGKQKAVPVKMRYYESATLRAGKPDVTQTGKKQDASVGQCIELYVNLMYLRKKVDQQRKKLRDAGMEKEAKEAVYLKASYYFLVQKTDNAKDGVYNPDFFNAPKAGNIVTLSMVYHAEDEGKELDIDLHYKEAVMEFKKGKESCDKKLCETCSLYQHCYHNLSPKYEERGRKQASLNGISLSEPQETAVNARKGFFVVNAGAGAGKTLVVALRTAYMIYEGIDPSKIILITFSNAGALEMKERVKLYLEDLGFESDDYQDLNIMTFNAFGDMVVKEHYEEFGFTAIPRLIDNTERAGIISKLLREHIIGDLDYRNFDMDMPYVKGALAATRESFEIIKRENLSYGDEDILLKKLGITAGSVSRNAAVKLIDLYDLYDKELVRQNLMEFADQEQLLMRFLKNHPYYFEENGFEHIVVDEFQDTSPLQFELLRIMVDTPDFQSLMVVGDDSQSIYSFRGCSPEFMIHFDEKMGVNSQKIYLLENHRSTPQILEFANQINALIEDRVEKDLVATRASGEIVHVDQFWTKEEENESIVKRIIEMHDRGVRYEDIAYIAGDRGDLTAMGTELTKKNIPWIMLNPELILGNSRAAGAIGLLRYLADQSDTESAFNYLNAKSKNTLFESYSDEQVMEMIEKMQKDVRVFFGIDSSSAVAILKEWLDALDDEDEIYEDFKNKILCKPSFEKMVEWGCDFSKYGVKEAVRRNLDYPGVVLVTAHSSKGMEWPIVFNSISSYHSSKMSKDVENEKRRLFFVSATRARDTLYVTGQSVAFGSVDNRTYNKFLVEAYRITGRAFSTVDPRLFKKKVS